MARKKSKPSGLLPPVLLTSVFATGRFDRMNERRKYCQHCGFVPKAHERELVVKCELLNTFFCSKCHELQHLAHGLVY